MIAENHPDMGVGINLAYRLYAIAVPLWAVVTYVWYAVGIALSPTAVATGWYAIAAYGAVLTVGLYLRRESAFSLASNRRRIETFRTHPFSGLPLNTYLLVLAVWSVVTAGWWAGVGGITLSATVVGYGWYATALFGAVTLVGLCATNLDLIVEAFSGSPESTRERL